MAGTPNRLEDHWKEIRPLLQEEWSELSEADFEYIDTRFDVLVEVIRQRYGGRAEIIQEAAIRDRINEILSGLEE